MGKQSLKRDSAKLTDQRIPAFVTRLVMEGPKLKPNPAKKTKSAKVERG